MEHWALDEVALPGRLVREMVHSLYQENQLCQGTLRLRDRKFGPALAQVPTLAVVNTADEIAPLASVQPFLDQMPGRDVRLIQFEGEPGVGLQHLALLAGRHARAKIWPAIDAWIAAHR